MSRHVLDRAVWDALSTCQSQFAAGGELARRFAADIGPLAAARDDTPQSLAALAELIPPSGPLVLLQAEAVALPPNTNLVMAAPGVQMVLEPLAFKPGSHSCRIEPLTEADIPQMVALAAMTKPGPFEVGTPRLGAFWGVKDGGLLVAMAGERMKHAGYTEVSGVCTHPEYRGRGLGRALSAAVAERILARGELPYLHAYATNTSAIQLYGSLGFRLRCPVHVAFVEAGKAAS